MPSSRPFFHTAAPPRVRLVPRRRFPVPTLTATPVAGKGGLLSPMAAVQVRPPCMVSGASRMVRSGVGQDRVEPGLPPQA